MERIERRRFLKLAGGAAMALGATSAVDALGNAFDGAVARQPVKRPNILVFLTDDHGQWAQRAYGNSELETPNFDRLAAAGTIMTNTFTTCPVCSPARASFFTGRMPSQHGIHDFLNENQFLNHPGVQGQRLLSEFLHDVGYNTGLVGKWHCGRERDPHPGFDRWFSYWVSQYPHEGVQNFSDQGQHVVENGQQSPLLTNHALDFLKAHRTSDATRKQPFFLYISYVDTHSPHNQAPEDLVARYQSASFVDIPNEEPAACHGKVINGKRPAKQERRRLAEYYAAASSVDREVGRILDDLKANGELENTFVVYTGDHGLNCGHHGVWEKGASTSPQNFLEESIRIACTVSWPAGGVKQGRRCTDFVNHCDLWKTILEVAAADPAPAILADINSPGRSYLGQLRGGADRSWSDIRYSEYGNARMARTDRYKLILRYPYGGYRASNELYDLHADPRETVNVYAGPGASGVVSELTEKLNAFFLRYSIPGRTGLDLDKLVPCNANPPWVEYATLQASARQSGGAPAGADPRIAE